jgi:hypothetical protein
LRKSIDPRFGVTFGIIVLAAFVVVLAVSLATLGWSGPSEYRRVMQTLVVSLLIIIAAALVGVWLASLMLPMENARTGPRDEIPRIRAEMEVIRNMLESPRKEIKQADGDHAVRHEPDKGAQ